MIEECPDEDPGKMKARACNVGLGALGSYVGRKVAGLARHGRNPSMCNPCRTPVSYQAPQAVGAYVTMHRARTVQGRANPAWPLRTGLMHADACGHPRHRKGGSSAG